MFFSKHSLFLSQRLEFEVIFYSPLSHPQIILFHLPYFNPGYMKQDSHRMKKKILLRNYLSQLYNTFFGYSPTEHVFRGTYSSSVVCISAFTSLEKNKETNKQKKTLDFQFLGNTRNPVRDLEVGVLNEATTNLWSKDALRYIQSNLILPITITEKDSGCVVLQIFSPQGNI